MKSFLLRFLRKFKGKNKVANQLAFNAEIVIIDDIFPNPLSDWRVNEYLGYLKNFSDVLIFTGTIKNDNLYIPESYKDWLDSFLNKTKFSQSRFHALQYNLKIDAKLGYCLFYNNLKYAFSIFEKNNIPFVFTLYPNGGFSIYDNECETQLSIFFSSRLFRHVIVNMPHVYDYIIQRFKLDINQITLIYGAPLNHSEQFLNNSNLVFNERINVVFVAHKYSKYGIDKGLDVFVKVANHFRGNRKISFTIIGDYTQSDLVCTSDNLAIITAKNPEYLDDILKNYQIVLSPNRSHVLHYGSFDGFPTGSVVHAAFCGCMMMLTDSWDNANSIGLINNVDLVLISDRPSEIVEKLSFFIDNPNEISKIAENGSKKLKQLINCDDQIQKRLDIINKYI